MLERAIGARSDLSVLFITRSNASAFYVFP